MDYLQYISYCIVLRFILSVLNLVINGLPSILKTTGLVIKVLVFVLNLVINGLPSILTLENIIQMI